MMPYFFSFNSSTVYWVGTIGLAEVSCGSVDVWPCFDGRDIRMVCFELGVGGSGSCLGGSEIRIVWFVEDLDGTPMRTVAFLAGLVSEAVKLS